MLSILVPRQADDGRRDQLWSWCQKRYRATGAEIVIGEDHGTPFSLPVAINAAAAKANGDVFFIGSADVAVDYAWLTEAERHVDQEPMQSVRCSRIHLLSQEITDALLERDPTTTVLTEEGNPVVAGSVGCIVFSRQLFELAGGMDERFRGWGPEDAAFHMALTTIGAPSFILDGDLRHLWHQPASGSWGSDHRQLLNEYEQAWGDKAKMELVVQRMAGSRTRPSASGSS